MIGESEFGSEPIFDPVSYINTPRWQQSHLGLERITELLRRMGNPQDSLHFVHVAGTNGKGSVCAYLSSVLTGAGYCTGLFVSPYIETFEERIQVNGHNITLDELTRATLNVRNYAEEVEKACGEHPTEFELMFAVALDHFSASRCDIVVCEVGLGGTFDATNAINAPEACVITRIGLDHTKILGDTLAQIAFEKSGIIKNGVPVITWPQTPEALDVIDRVIADRGCTRRIPDFTQLDVQPLSLSRISDETQRRFSYKQEQYTTRLLGSYQPQNAALAIETADVLREQGWNTSHSAVVEGISLAKLPGRFEVIGEKPLVIVDGAHNPQGALALADSLKNIAGEKAVGDVVFVMGVLVDKDYCRMIEAVLPLARAFITCTPNNTRALDADVLAQVIEDEYEHTQAQGDQVSPLLVQSEPEPKEAVIRACEIAGRHGMVVAFGSFYLISGVKAAFG